ncbi:hypothetical protein EDD18DRAFT_744840 [Armillaria luteobubalina]|uniref:Uncharacterized protein n=1 Tax=Armillaria luteobubalina TaxID=153913 RepID=A0AA39QGJ9_9AGAR|nr:hypothetical protein EDD18DRAFT_744840 [Armillaria luteobubalina]
MERHSSKCLPCSEIAVIGTWSTSTTTTASSARTYRRLEIAGGIARIRVHDRTSDDRVHKLAAGPYFSLSGTEPVLYRTAAADKRAFVIYTFPAQRPLPFVWRSKSVVSHNIRLRSDDSASGETSTAGSSWREHYKLPGDVMNQLFSSRPPPLCRYQGPLQPNFSSRQSSFVHLFVGGLVSPFRCICNEEMIRNLQGCLL